MYICILQSLSARSLQQIFNFSPDMHYGLGWTTVIQLVATHFISQTFFSGITELVNNIQHSVGKIQHLCVLKDDGGFTTDCHCIFTPALAYLEKQIHLVNMLESVLRSENIVISSLDDILWAQGSPPDLTNSSLLAVQVVQGVICHVVAVIEKGNPFQDLMKFVQKNTA